MLQAFWSHNLTDLLDEIRPGSFDVPLPRPHDPHLHGVLEMLDRVPRAVIWSERGARRTILYSDVAHGVHGAAMEKFAAWLAVPQNRATLVRTTEPVDLRVGDATHEPYAGGARVDVWWDDNEGTIAFRDDVSDQLTMREAATNWRWLDAHFITRVLLPDQARARAEARADFAARRARAFEEEVLVRASAVLGSDVEAAAWLRTPNDAIGGVAPINLALIGETASVIRLLDTADASRTQDAQGPRA